MQFDPVLVHDWLTRTASHQPDKIALVSRGQRLTYREIEEKSSSLASTLILMGFRKGDRAIICLENSPEAVISIYGVLKAGGIFAVIEPRSPWPILSSIINDSGARFLITYRQKLFRREGLKTDIRLPERHFQIIIVDGAHSAPHAYPGALKFSGLIEKLKVSVALPRILETDLACLVYTSGSTGKPKGIMCTHRNVVTAARSIIQYLQNSCDDIILDVLPLSFDYGLYQVIMSFMFGGTVVLEPSLGYIQDVLSLIERERVTGFPLIPSISAMLLRLKKFPARHLKSLRYITSTAAAWPLSHIQKLRENLPDVKIYSMYGLSECKRVSYLPPDLIDRHPDSVGLPMPNLEVAIVNQQGKRVSTGQVGELIVRGPTVMQGYWRDKNLTRRVFKQGKYADDRWLYTGDLFRQDENGLLYFVGRRDRQIKSFGHRINLTEIEKTVSRLEGALEAAALPVSDDIGGEVIGLFVASKKGSKIDEAQIKQFCQQNLEPYKIPRHIWLKDSLPRTPNGKIDYKKLTAWLNKPRAGAESEK
ncbi:MAG: class I adenylate-forming enzyme family protein [Candidatus Saccharicenans sp.]|uniref:class I adenylate-forming enzyme family protein n=1 Tax=Candidatus Saccharicenans sp. TaxID=2819258 RepID=UPI004048F2F4